MVRPFCTPPIAPRSRSRLWALGVVAVLHGLAIVGLIRAFTPEVGPRLARAALAAFSLTPEPAPPPPAAKPAAKPARAAAGASGLAGKQAVPRAVTAPSPRIAMAPMDAPIVGASGAANTSGARDAGVGTGGGGPGDGTGQGNGGNGQGGGAKPVKTAGEINSARDYPIASRDMRIDDYVIIALTISAEGRPTACRIHRPSRDAQANAITCQLAMARFRFRPATNAAGEPVESVFGWQQKWHY